MRDAFDVLDLTLELPIGGKTYTVPPPSAAVGVDLQNKLALGVAADAGVDLGDLRGQITVTDDELPDFARQCLGPVYDQLLTDDVPKPVIDFAVTTAFLAWTVGKAFAEMFWETGGEMGKAPRGSQPPTATPTPSAAATSTPSPASPSGTRTTSTSAEPAPPA